MVTSLPPQSVSGPGRTVWHVPGFFYLYRKQRQGRNFYFVFRGWLLLFVFCALPLIWAAWFRRPAIRSEYPICANCGYDLRASKDRCPECGTRITVATTSS
jgi:hypothetical protein